MLPKQNRLKKKKDFDRVFNRGSYLSTPFFLIKSIKNDLNFSRFGFIVSKKVSSKATVRNKLKRIMRETVRQRVKDKQGLDVVFIAKSVILEHSPSKIREEINKILDSL